MPSAAPAAFVKSGGAGLRTFLAVIVVGGAMLMLVATSACSGKKGSGVTSLLSGSASGRHSSGSSGDVRSALLSKEEVGAIIGIPVTSIVMSGKSDASYRTATMGMDSSIEVNRTRDEADAIQNMAAARQVTRSAFGGKAEAVAGIGDEALYGAFNVLYVRKNDVFLIVTPPNLQQAAQMAQYTNMTSQPLGSDGQKKAMEKFQETMKGDPTSASLAKPDAMSGAVDLIHHAASEQGTEYETKARAMARQMAEQVLTKISA
jgi:hypothetical protein